MLDMLSSQESAGAYSLRAWTGVATDEGVGLISMVEVADERGLPMCRFEVFAGASVLRGQSWPRDEGEALRRLQHEALDRARDAALAGRLAELHGHRFDLGR
ncbi:MAG TPA: hypothetical protein VFY10_03800 [Dehalococcoidia bacterium]|nr:hypothetical protein [Dehalococcoidia bacterium]